MSRSLHTQKLEIRAARRLVRPYGTRREHGARLSGRMSSGNIAPAHPAVSAVASLPIRAQQPAFGCIHPLCPRDIRRLIEFTGCASFYGLHMIRLRHECGMQHIGLVFAEYVVPDEIHLYSVPTPPWRLSFLLSDHDIAAFVRHGARTAVDARLRKTTVEWPGNSLRDFYLIEVLSHELGHHLLQHNAGKRTAQVRRRRDHERFADLHSRRTYVDLLSRGSR